MAGLVKKMISFHLADVLGLALGIFLISYSTDTELFHLIIYPQAYVIVLAFVFLYHSWIWLFAYHGERVYTKQMFAKTFKNFFRIIFAVVSIVGAYFLWQSLKTFWF